MSDLISRQGVIDLVEELEARRLRGDIDLLYAPMIKGVRAMPSAQPELKKGGWVNARDGYDGHVKCNKCFKTYDWVSDAQYFNFCPNCGADMRGEQNG